MGGLTCPQARRNRDNRIFPRSPAAFIFPPSSSCFILGRMKHLLLSAIGKDRPGFVHDVTQAVHQGGGNIEQQRSVRLANEYVVMLLVSLEDTISIDGLIKPVQALASHDLLIRVREAGPGDYGESMDVLSAEVSASGADQPGILEAVTSLLVKHGINIDGMDYDTEGAPMTGDQLFRMDAFISVPAGVDVQAVRQEMRALEDEFNFDILFRQV